MLQAKTKRNASLSTGTSGIPLMDGEEVHASVGVKSDGTFSGGDVVLLTDKRVIRSSGSDSNQSLAFAALSDVGAVELTRHPAIGYSAYVWAAIAFFVSFMLWRVIENQAISIAAAIVVAIMGVYLIVDRLTTRGEHLLVFKAGGGDIRVELDGAGRQADAEALITRLFELKDERALPQYARASRFSPR